MADTTRAKDGAELLEIIAKLRTKERLSASEREAFRVAFTPLVRSVVRKVVWRRGRTGQAYLAAREESVQEAWLLLLEDILPDYTPTRGDVFAFAKVCLRNALLDEMKKEERRWLTRLTYPETVEDKSSVEWVLTDDAWQWLCSAIAKAKLKERQIIWARMEGQPYEAIAPVVGMSVAATRLAMHRLVTRLREAAATTDF